MLVYRLDLNPCMPAEDLSPLELSMVGLEEREVGLGVGGTAGACPHLGVEPCTSGFRDNEHPPW